MATGHRSQSIFPKYKFTPTRKGSVLDALMRRMTVFGEVGESRATSEMARWIDGSKAPC